MTEFLRSSRTEDPAVDKAHTPRQTLGTGGDPMELTDLERAAADLSADERHLIKRFAADRRNLAAADRPPLAAFWQHVMLSVFAAEDYERDLLTSMMDDTSSDAVESDQTEGKVSDPLAAGQAPPPDGRTATPLDRESASAPRGRRVRLVSRFLPSKDRR